MRCDVPGVLIDTFNQITGPGGVSMSVSACRRRGSAPHLTGIPDYFAWTLRNARLKAAGNGALHTLAQDLLDGWHPALRRIADRADIPDTFLVTVASARPVPPWRVPNVTLLGDAIHTMSPGRGEGASVALRDAALLCRTLAAGERKEQYETQMMHYAFHAVAESRDRPFSRGPASRTGAPLTRGAPPAGREGAASWSRRRR